jgi:D-glutamate N-acetyltransferase
VSGERLAVLTEGLFDDHHAKTAHGVIRYGTREVVAVVDSSQAGRTASEVVAFCQKPVPIVATIEEAVERGAQTMLIGIAPTGGRLDDEWRALVLEAIERGLNVEAGLHTILADDPQFAAAAQKAGVTLRDLRLPPADLGVPRGPTRRREGVRVVHSVGSDVAIGKKAVTVELDVAARARGLSSVYVPTGQTGVAIAGWGIAVDHVLADYVSGAAERLVDEGGDHGELLFVEGQGSLFHPAYSAVTLGLLHGCSPDLLILAHRAGATHFEGYPDVALPSLPELIAAYEAVCRPLRPVRVVAIALNTSRLGEDEARAAIAQTEDETGLAADDLVRYGADRVLDAVLTAFQMPT